MLDAMLPSGILDLSLILTIPYAFGSYTTVLTPCNMLHSVPVLVGC